MVQCDPSNIWMKFNCIFHIFTIPNDTIIGNRKMKYQWKTDLLSFVKKFQNNETQKQQKLESIFRKSS